MSSHDSVELVHLYLEVAARVELRALAVERAAVSSAEALRAMASADPCDSLARKAACVLRRIEAEAALRVLAAALTDLLHDEGDQRVITAQQIAGRLCLFDHEVRDLVGYEEWCRETAAVASTIADGTRDTLPPEGEVTDG